MTDLLEITMDEKAVELAVVLNAVADDDERERLEHRFERRLNAELFHGSEVRAAVGVTSTEGEII